MHPYFHAAMAITDPYLNPLFQATHTIEEQLRNIGPLTNSTAINSLHKSTPFIQLRCDPTAFATPTIGCGRLSLTQSNTAYSLRARKPTTRNAVVRPLPSTGLDSIPPDSNDECHTAAEEVKAVIN